MKRTCLVLLCFFISVLYKHSIGQTPLPANQLQVNIPHKPTPVTIDNKATLVYEVQLTNTAGTALEITGFSIVNLSSKDTILHYGQAALNSQLQPMATSGKPGTIIQPTQTHILYIEASTTSSMVPTIFHHLRFRSVDDPLTNSNLLHDTLSFTGTKPVVLANPLRGGNWAAIYAAAWQRGHRRVVYTVDGRHRIPGRFAIDFVKIDSVQYAIGNEDSIQNWHGYAAEVLAVADGEVAAMRNDFKESATLSAHPDHRPEQATGNYITVKIAANKFVFYEHLQPGSIKVAVGQRIKKGQVIARLGFTGQTTGPHLHLHVADSNSPLGAEGIPFVFETFTLIGRYPDFNQFGKAPFQTTRPEKRRKQMPPSNTVIVF